MLAKFKANGIDISYQTTGEGPDLVMVHGLAANMAFWYLRIVPALAQQFRVTVFDLRGHGHTSMPPTGYTTAHMADDLAALMDHIGAERAHIAGHSLGGSVALHYATLHPERLESLAMIDSRLHVLQPLRNPHDDAYWAERRAALAARGITVDEETPRVVYLILDELGTVPKTGLGNGSGPGIMGAEGGWDPKSRAAKRWKKLVTETSFAQDIRCDGGLTREAIAAVDVPVLLSYGSDSYCLPTYQELVTLIPEAKRVVHQGLGHFFPLVRPELVVADIMGFLDHLTPSEPTISEFEG